MSNKNSIKCWWKTYWNKIWELGGPNVHQHNILVLKTAQQLLPGYNWQFFFKSRNTSFWGAIKYSSPITVMRSHQGSLTILSNPVETTADWGVQIKTCWPGEKISNVLDNIYKCIFFNKNLCILIDIRLKFVHSNSIDNKSVEVYIMAWNFQEASHYLNQCWHISPMQICINWPQWVNSSPQWIG